MGRRPAILPLGPNSSGNKPLQFWTIIPDAFSLLECNRLTDLYSRLDTLDGGLVAGHFDQKIRHSGVTWVPEIKDFAWVDTRMIGLVRDANRQLFGYDLDGVDEQLQLAAYGPGHYYDWHIDRGQGGAAGRRKLSLSVQLTSPDDYVGGALVINADGNPIKISRAQGTAVVFAASTLHRIEPVISGLRHSLVSWAHGPALI